MLTRLYLLAASVFVAVMLSAYAAKAEDIPSKVDILGIDLGMTYEQAVAKIGSQFPNASAPEMHHEGVEISEFQARDFPYSKINLEGVGSIYLLPNPFGGSEPILGVVRYSSYPNEKPLFSVFLEEAVRKYGNPSGEDAFYGLLIWQFGRQSEKRDCDKLTVAINARGSSFAPEDRIPGFVSPLILGKDHGYMGGGIIDCGTILRLHILKDGLSVGAFSASLVDTSRTVGTWQKYRQYLIDHPEIGQLQQEKIKPRF
ncbi:MAG: hypothetical protein ACLPX9_03420 [Rhodomicrobium sp.]